MAVQAAVMNHHFMPLYFPGSMVEYEKSYHDGTNFLGDVESGEFKEASRDLLSFINTASSNIKLALDKPVKSKRKVNHRKYLQKQIKRCTGMISNGNCSQGSSKGQSISPGNINSPSFHCKPPPKRDNTQSNLQSKSLAALFENAKEVCGEKCKKVPLRNRNLPPSFFREPVNATSGLISSSGITLKELEKGNPESIEFFELLGQDYNNISEQDIIQGASVRIHQDVTAEHSLYEPHPLLNGLLYPDPWNPCNQIKKSPVGTCSLNLNETLKSVSVPASIYTNNTDPAITSSVEDSCTNLPSFTPCFPECSLPQMFYDYSSGYNRIGYSVL
ncbi:protein FAM181B [Bombina bombina]|uniref:protein FAM181B n=1 Tax=Bombina bombina TaxID=8345 RepID=UPI00235AD17C|nr:protein FAM181B [Bombina bombina]